MLERSFSRVFVTSVVFSIGAAHMAATQTPAMDEVRASKRVTAVRITEPIRLDGILDEAVWQLAEPAKDFHQQWPDEFAPATRRSEVRFLYDDDNLYVGAMLYDEAPETLITNELKRDFAGFTSDSMALILDTFLDRSSSYGFLTNPGGAMRDAMNADNGRLHDANWNGVWDVRSALLPNGWSTELVIPFKTLRFPAGEVQEWGLNIQRNARNVNERSTWSPVPRQLSHYDVGFAGTLVGIEGVRPGRNIYVTPFATAEIGKGLEGNPDWDGDADGGVDLKWGITSSLVLDGTWRTDFAQVEADAQQINLTRFPLFFPEKRQFFLESPGNFQIGLQQTFGGRRDLVPFFTRRIGLKGGQPVPVIGGVRLTGRPGRQSIGFLNMTTREFGGDPGDNFTALLLKRTLSDTTSAGGFYFGRESSGSNSFNRVGGVDFSYSPNRTFDVEAFAMHSGTAGREGDWAGRTGFLLTETHHNARVFWLHVGDTFQHDLGFVRRRGIGTFYGEYSYIIQPASPDSRVRDHTLGVNLELTGDDRYTQLLTRIGNLNYTLKFSDESQIVAAVSSNFDRLDRPFFIGSLPVPVGEYQFEDAEISYSSNAAAAVSGGVGVLAGEYYTGRRRNLNGDLRVRLSEKLAASATFSREFVDLPNGEFTGDLVGLRLDTSFNPRMFLNAFIQYNGETDSWISNIRFNLIHRPLSDIFVVWNETRQPGFTQRALLLKYTHLIAF